MGRGGLITADVGPGISDPGQEGNTPLDEAEASGLIPEHLTTRRQLNEWEQANISSALEWLETRRDQESILESGFLNELHRRMFGNTWKWAGTFRRTEKNIGIAPNQISGALLNLLADVEYWIQHKSFPVDEIAVRFHHRLVAIHQYPNGNGRHARLATDLLLESLGTKRFSWGSGDLDHEGDVRSRYLHSLREADIGSIAALKTFARA